MQLGYPICEKNKVLTLCLFGSYNECNHKPQGWLTISYSPLTTPVSVSPLTEVNLLY